MPNIVKVPKPSGKAYNPNRPIEKNALIQAQVAHFREAEAELPGEMRVGIDFATVLTEGDAAQYIVAVTRALRKRGGRPEPKVETAR